AHAPGSPGSPGGDLTSFFAKCGNWTPKRGVEGVELAPTLRELLDRQPIAHHSGRWASSPDIPRGAPNTRGDRGMNRRHFLTHVAGCSALAVPGLQFLQTLRAAEDKLKKENKSLIIFWMGGGPSHMDLWDLKPGAPTGGEFKTTKTKA